MNVQFEPPATYFAHVPKTGGISLGTILEKCFAKRDYIKLNPPAMAQIAIPDLGRFRCYHDMHHGRSMMTLIGRSDLLCVTMLREPVERSVSQIRYLQRTVARIPETFTPEYLAQVRPILQSDLSTCVDPVAFASACDSQAMMLGVLRDYTPFFKGSPDAASGRSVVRPYEVPVLTDLSNDAQILDNARRWLADMAVVGLSERYAESVELMCAALGIPTPAALPRENRNPERDDMTSRYRNTLPSKVLAQLEELTALDREVYAAGCALFEQQWSRHLARRVRRYSFAPRLRLAVRRIKRRAKRLQNRTSMSGKAQ